MFENLFAAGIILAHQDWKRMKCGAAVLAVNHPAGCAFIMVSLSTPKCRIILTRFIATIIYCVGRIILLGTGIILKNPGRPISPTPHQTQYREHICITVSGRHRNGGRSTGIFGKANLVGCPMLIF